MTLLSFEGKKIPLPDVRTATFISFGETLEIKGESEISNLLSPKMKQRSKIVYAGFLNK